MTNHPPIIRRFFSKYPAIFFFLLGYLLGPLNGVPFSHGNALPARTLIGHQGEIFGLAFDPTTNLLASGSGDQSIRLWDMHTGRLQTILKGHTAPVRTLAFSPKGHFLASGASDKTTRIWDLQTGKEVGSFSSVFGNVRAVTFAPENEDILVSTGDGGSLRLIDWKAKKELKAMKSGFGIIYTVAFSPSGSILATGNSDTHIHIWDPISGQQQTRFSGHSKAVLSVAFSPDGALLASGSADSTVRLWDVRTGRERGVLLGHSGEVTAVAFTQDGATVISAGSDGTVRFWDRTTSRSLNVLADHKGPVWALAVARDGTAMAFGGRERNVHVQSAAINDPTLFAQPVSPSVIPRDADVGPPPVPPPHAEADFSIHPHEIKPGDALTVDLQVSNTGKGPLYRFLATIRSANPLLHGRTFYFGKIPPGQSKSEQLTITLPQEITAEAIPLDIHFEEYNGFVPDPLKAVILLHGPPRPRLAYNYQIVDNGTGQSVGNGDGRIQKGEAVDLLLTIKNVGTVPAKDTWVELINEEGQHLDIRPHIIRFGHLDPDGTKQARISFTIWPDFPKDQLGFDLLIKEKDQNVFLNERVDLSVDTQPPQQIVATNKIVTVTQDRTSLLSGAGAESSVIATVEKSQSLAVTGELGDWYRVQLSEKETGWIAKQQVSTLQASIKGEMPIPMIKGLEANKAAQFITLSEQLQQAEQERSRIERTLKQREQEMAALKSQLEQMAASQHSTLSITQGQLERERAERERILQALQNRELEAQQLQAQLKATTNKKSSELSSMREHLQQEQAQREQAENALNKFKQEMAALQAKLEQMHESQVATKTPPAIALATPYDQQIIKIDRVQLVGAAASDRGIARIEVRVNDELLARRQGRGVAVVSSKDTRESTMEFSETVLLREGENTISVVAYDGDLLSSTRTLRVTREVSKGKIWAVVIGISQYQTVRSLKYADKDALAFRDYLVNNVGIHPDHLTVLTNEQATLMNLKRSLGTDLKRKAGPKDTVIIFYAGHGAPEPDASSPDGDGLEKYLIPYDADPQDLYTTGLPMREVETIFHRLSADRVIFITDSCYSGATAGRTFSVASRRANLSDGFLTRLSKGKGRVVLTASRAGEVSEERDDLGHGVFTYYLLEGLKGKADVDGDGVVTVDEAYLYLSTHVPQATGQNQHPVKKGEFEGQLILGRTDF